MAAVVDIWMDKQDGTRPVIGEASAVWSPDAGPA
jgi:hypothetical protein